jgi:YidC/Oxa1 family membrane protein insertase
MDRFRVALAIILSALIIFGWPLVMRYLYPAPPTPPVDEQSYTAPQQTVPEQTGAAVPTPTKPSERPAPPAKPGEVASTQAPLRELLINTEYWRIKLSNRGAVATSWILHKQEPRPIGGGGQIYAASGGDLELIPQDTLELLGAPLRVSIPGALGLASTLNTVNFEIADVPPGNDTIDLGPGDQREITFVYTSSGTRATKKFKFYGGQSVFDVTVEVTGETGRQPVELVIGPRIGDQTDKQSGSYSTPPQVVSFSIKGSRDHELGTKITQTIAKVSAVDVSSSRITLDKPFNAGVDEAKLVGVDGKTFLAYAKIASREAGNTVLALDPLPAGLTPGCSVAPAIDIHRDGYQWAGISDRYFAMVAIPSRPVGEIAMSSVELKTGADQAERDYPSVAVPVDPGSSLRIFVGPKDRKLLAKIGTELGTDLGALIDYGMFSFMIRPLVPAIGWALDGLARLFHNYGWSIVVLTIMINLALSPLRWFSSKKMKSAAKHQPRLKELQERMKKLKENPKKYEREMQQLQQEQIALMKEANPLGGCLPLLLQMPIFWAFFVFLTISLDVRQAPWILWIKDLSTADQLHVLPIVMCVTMIASTWLTPQPAQADPAMKMQRIMMTWLMPIMLTWFFFLSAPSGLVLYWMVSNMVGVAIQLVINKRTAEPTPAPGTGSSKSINEPALAGAGGGKAGKSNKRGRTGA